jgi:dihydroorotate dehydrogenase electron transfer subunit
LALPQIVRIRHIQDEARSICTFVLDAEIPEAKPGQFVMLWLPGVDEKPISIARPAPLTLTVARVGPFSTELHRRKVGSRVGWRGPYGRGFSLHEERPALLVAGGYGAAPLYFLATEAIERGIPVTVALGARTTLDLLYVERFRALGAERIILATDDGSTGYRGYVTDAIQSSISDLQSFVIYACGPERMLVALHRLCRERDIPGQISVDRYMKCGFGVCGQCALDDLLVCQDGPVLDVEQLDGLRDFGRVHRSATGRRLPIR